MKRRREAWRTTSVSDRINRPHGNLVQGIPLDQRAPTISWAVIRLQMHHITLFMQDRLR